MTCWKLRHLFKTRRESNLYELEIKLKQFLKWIQRCWALTGLLSLTISILIINNFYYFIICLKIIRVTILYIKISWGSGFQSFTYSLSSLKLTGIKHEMELAVVSASFFAEVAELFIYRISKQCRIFSTPIDSFASKSWPIDFNPPQYDSSI